MEEIRDKIAQVLSDKFNVTTYTAYHTFADLGLDTLDMTELIMDLEQEFDVEISDDHNDIYQTIHTFEETLFELWQNI